VNERKVWIITSGEYSDYSIDAVFLDEESAKKYMERYEEVHGDRYRMQIEVFNVGTVPEEIHHATIVMVLATGDVTREEKGNAMPAARLAPEWKKQWNLGMGDVPARLVVTGLDLEHARKRAGDLRRARLAAGGPIPGLEEDQPPDSARIADPAGNAGKPDKPGGTGPASP
jgi:hypothetical protein